jgi:hypothetical protein
MTSASQPPAVYATQPSHPAVRRWSPGLVSLAALVVGFLAFAVPPYVTLDVSRSRIPPPAGMPAYYPLLVTHVLFASVAMVTAPLQVWTWFRQRHRTAHRMVGRVYFFCGVLPAGIAGLLLGAVSPFGPIIRASNVLLAILWLTCTTAGFRMARARRFVDHQRWMTRSVVLTMSIITNRVWATIATVWLMPQLSTTFEGNEMLMVQTIAGLSGWLGWVLPLLVTEWWLIDRPTSSTTGRVRPASALIT